MTTNANNLAFANPPFFGTPCASFKMSPMLVSNYQKYYSDSKNVNFISYELCTSALSVHT